MLARVLREFRHNSHVGGVSGPLRRVCSRASRGRFAGRDAVSSPLLRLVVAAATPSPVNLHGRRGRVSHSIDQPSGDSVAVHKALRARWSPSFRRSSQQVSSLFDRWASNFGRARPSGCDHAGRPLTYPAFASCRRDSLQSRVQKRRGPDNTGQRSGPLSRAARCTEGEIPGAAIRIATTIRASRQSTDRLQRPAPAGERRAAAGPPFCRGARTSPRHPGGPPAGQWPFAAGNGQSPRIRERYLPFARRPLFMLRPPPSFATPDSPRSPSQRSRPASSPRLMAPACPEPK